MKTEYQLPPRMQPESLSSFAPVVKSINDASRSLGWPVNLAVLSCAVSLETVLKRWGAQYAHQRLDFAPVTWVLDVPRRENASPDVVQWFVVEHSPGVAVLVSNEHRDFFLPIMKRWVQRYQPLISPVFLPTHAMRRVLKSVNEQRGTRGPVMVTELLTRSKLDAPTARKFLESTRVWTDRPFDQVFDNLREDKKWTNRVHFEFESDERETGSFMPVQGSISRDGYLTSDGSLSTFFNSIVRAVAEESRRVRSLFVSRGSQESPTGRARPLVIDYDEPVFEDRRQNRFLVKVMEHIPHIGISVLHANPYLHASLVDYLDGSMYDVWVVRSNRITLIPKSRASAASLERVCGRISSDFRDGEIRDYEEATAEDIDADTE